jgi:hypothetical protein
VRPFVDFSSLDVVAVVTGVLKGAEAGSGQGPQPRPQAGSRQGPTP